MLHTPRSTACHERSLWQYRCWPRTHLIKEECPQQRLKCIRKDAGLVLLSEAAGERRVRVRQEASEAARNGSVEWQSHSPFGEPPGTRQAPASIRSPLTLSLWGPAADIGPATATQHGARCWLLTPTCCSASSCHPAIHLHMRQGGMIWQFTVQLRAATWQDLSWMHTMLPVACCQQDLDVHRQIFSPSCAANPPHPWLEAGA
jgi:hypothetical protein